MPPGEYLDATYYERWMYGLERRLERAGSLAPGDVDEALARVAGAPLPERNDPELTERVLVIQRSGKPLPAAAAPRFAPGDGVRVRRMRPEGHTRCPRYVRGATGVIERVHGDDLLARCRRARRGRPGRGGLRGELPLRGPLRAGRGAAVPRARRPLGVVPRGAGLMHDHDHDHGTITATTSGRPRIRRCGRGRSRRCSSSAA